MEGEKMLGGHIPRAFQEDAFLMARTTNTVMVGDTGVGKTLVALMLLRDVHQRNPSASIDTPKGEKTWSLFLAPTQELVFQQRDRIKTMTGLSASSFVGRDLDLWSAGRWRTELERVEVAVMTPGALANLLMRGPNFLSLESVLVLILDECHQAKGAHPYCQIMKYYREALRFGRAPLIFGMTATPLPETTRTLMASAFVCNTESDEVREVSALAPTFFLRHPLGPLSSTDVDTMARLVNALLANGSRSGFVPLPKSRLLHATECIRHTLYDLGPTAAVAHLASLLEHPQSKRYSQDMESARGLWRALGCIRFLKACLTGSPTLSSVAEQRASDAAAAALFDEQLAAERAALAALLGGTPAELHLSEAEALYAAANSYKLLWLVRLLLKSAREEGPLLRCMVFVERRATVKSLCLCLRHCFAAAAAHDKLGITCGYVMGRSIKGSGYRHWSAAVVNSGAAAAARAMAAATQERASASVRAASSGANAAGQSAEPLHCPSAAAGDTGANEFNDDDGCGNGMDSDAGESAGGRNVEDNALCNGRFGGDITAEVVMAGSNTVRSGPRGMSETNGSQCDGDDAADLGDGLWGSGSSGSGSAAEAAAADESADLKQLATYACTIQAFREGKINVLVTTDTCSEGIDVPECSLVVAMDRLQTTRSLMHTRGRARSRTGKFVVMIPDDDDKERKRVREMLRESEEIRRGQLGDPNDGSGYTLRDKFPDMVVRFEPGLVLDLDVAMQLLYEALQALGCSCPPLFEVTHQPPLSSATEVIGGNFTAVARLPRHLCRESHDAQAATRAHIAAGTYAAEGYGAGADEEDGFRFPYCATKREARAVAAFKALLGLHRRRYLDDRLRPFPSPKRLDLLKLPFYDPELTSDHSRLRLPAPTYADMELLPVASEVCEPFLTPEEERSRCSTAEADAGTAQVHDMRSSFASASLGAGDGLPRVSSGGSDRSSAGLLTVYLHRLEPPRPATAFVLRAGHSLLPLGVVSRTRLVPKGKAAAAAAAAGGGGGLRMPLACGGFVLECQELAMTPKQLAQLRDFHVVATGAAVYGGESAAAVHVANALGSRFASAIDLVQPLVTNDEEAQAVAVDGAEAAAAEESGLYGRDCGYVVVPLRLTAAGAEAVAAAVHTAAESVVAWLDQGSSCAGAAAAVAAASAADAVEGGWALDWAAVGGMRCAVEEAAASREANKATAADVAARMAGAKAAKAAQRAEEVTQEAEAAAAEAAAGGGDAAAAAAAAATGDAAAASAGAGDAEPLDGMASAEGPAASAAPAHDAAIQAGETAAATADEKKEGASKEAPAAEETEKAGGKQEQDVSPILPLPAPRPAELSDPAMGDHLVFVRVSARKTRCFAVYGKTSITLREYLDNVTLGLTYRGVARSYCGLLPLSPAMHAATAAASAAAAADEPQTAEIASTAADAAAAAADPKSPSGTKRKKRKSFRAGESSCGPQAISVARCHTVPEIRALAETAAADQRLYVARRMPAATSVFGSALSPLLMGNGVDADASGALHEKDEGRDDEDDSDSDVPPEADAPSGGGMVLGSGKRGQRGMYPEVLLLPALTVRMACSPGYYLSAMGALPAVFCMERRLLATRLSYALGLPNRPHVFPAHTVTVKVRWRKGGASNAASKANIAAEAAESAAAGAGKEAVVAAGGSSNNGDGNDVARNVEDGMLAAAHERDADAALKNGEVKMETEEEAAVAKEREPPSYKAAKLDRGVYIPVAEGGVLALMERAMRRPSNERLEMFGDAYLKLSMALVGYLAEPDLMEEGLMTELKDNLVSNARLLQHARRAGLMCRVHPPRSIIARPWLHWLPPLALKPARMGADAKAQPATAPNAAGDSHGQAEAAAMDAEAAAAMPTENVNGESGGQRAEGDGPAPMECEDMDLAEAVGGDKADEAATAAATDAMEVEAAPAEASEALNSAEDCATALQEKKPKGKAASAAAANANSAAAKAARALASAKEANYVGWKVTADAVEALLGAGVLSCGWGGGQAALAWLKMPTLPGWPSALPLPPAREPSPGAIAALEARAAPLPPDVPEWAQWPLPGWRGRGPLGPDLEATARAARRFVPREYIRYRPADNIWKGLDDLQARLRYRFRHPFLLLQAVTHPSWTACDLTWRCEAVRIDPNASTVPSGEFVGAADFGSAWYGEVGHDSEEFIPLNADEEREHTLPTKDYQRLEFLGDAVLGFLTTVQLFSRPDRYGGFSPGEMTEVLHNVVSNHVLAALAVEHLNITKAMRCSLATHAKAEGYLKAFSEARQQSAARGEDDVGLMTAVRTAGIAPKFIADMFESCIGAIYLDSGGDMTVVSAVVWRMVGPVADRTAADIAIGVGASTKFGKRSEDEEELAEHLKGEAAREEEDGLAAGDAIAAMEQEGGAPPMLLSALKSLGGRLVGSGWLAGGDAAPRAAWQNTSTTP